MTKASIAIVSVHTLLVAIMVLPSFGPGSSNEDGWPFFGVFILDFPVSVLFHWSVDGIANAAQSLIAEVDRLSVGAGWLAFCHFVFGALWWVLLVNVVRKAFHHFSRFVDGQA